MVIGEEAAVIQQPQTTMPPANIDNIMSGIGNTGTVKMNNHRKKLRQRFDIIKKLGQGTYGKVQLGINKETGQEVAIKTIKKCKIETEADLIRIRREVQIMSSVQHPNIIHIYEVFENKEKMVLVMEFAAGGELYDYLSERKVLTEEEARRVFRQISTAIYYCHKHKICHRDLKLENILLDEHGNAKIADFGLSNVFDEQRLLATFCGSPLYASPEIVKGTPYQGPEVDCWSLGVLLYTLVYGAMPFDGSNFKRLVKQISQGEYYEPKKASAASPLIREMLTVCPKRRATIENICNHWWVNEGYDESCLDLAEELANQTPVRLDVLLSLSPPSVTAEQLVVPAPVQESKSSDRVSRSHSVGSVIDMANTEAERRIIDMVAQGGEAALMPSPTRTITPAESPAQSKRKLETTVSTENATGAVKKREKSFNPATASKLSIAETMEIDPDKTPTNRIPAEDVIKPADLDKIENICDELMTSTPNIKPSPSKKVVKKKEAQPTSAPPSAITPQTDVPVAEKGDSSPEAKESPPAVDQAQQNAAKALEARRKSKVFETAEKFQNMNAQNTEKAKKFGASIGNVGNFKKEFEKKATTTGTNLAAAAEQAAPKSPEKKVITYPKVLRKTSLDDSKTLSTLEDGTGNSITEGKIHDSKSSLANFSLEEARKSMENSIALLNQAKNESSKEVDQLCAQTENVTVNENDREKKLKSARDIIGNAIQPGRLCMGVRKPPVPFGLNGRSISGSVLPSSTGYERKPLRVQVGPEPSDLATATYSVSTPEQKLYTQDPLTGLRRPIAVATVDENPEFDDTPKTSRAEITLKSATLPRRKPVKPDVKLEIEQKPTSERGMRFSTEMQHQVPDLRSAPIREHPYSPVPTSINQRATSLEPQQKEIIIPIQRPPRLVQQPGAPPSFRPGTLSRQSTNESDTETTITTPTLSSTATLASSSSTTQPIKKSPREFIIPIAVEGGGYITPRAGSLEPSESNTTTNTTGSSFSKIGRPRRMGSLLNETNLDEDSPFTRLHRHTSIGRDSDNEEPRFHTMHRLRSTRPLKRVVQDPNDSASSGDDDDEDGFEILTAENLFSTLLSRVRALTNRLNVNDTHGFSSSRLMSNLRQPHSSFWNHDPFASNLNNSSSSWRHTISRDLGSDIDSMFSRSGATLPRGTKFRTSSTANNNNNNSSSSSNNNNSNQNSNSNNINSNDNNNSNNSGSQTGKLDLQDLDLSRLRLTKKDLETLSSLTPNLPKEVQEQLLAQLPPNQARKLSRTLSMQNNLADTSVTSIGLNHTKPYKRSLSGGRDLCDSSTAAAVASSRVLAKSVTPSRNEIFDRNSVYRRSLSKTRYDAAVADATKVNSRSSSRCRDSVGDITDESSRSYLSDVSKYKSYRSSDYDNSSSTLSPTNESYTNLPPLSGCISPPPLPNDVTMRRRSTSKRISRFLRPDFFDTPREESIYVNKDNKDRDPESRRLLKEIRERSRERSLERTRGASSDRLSYLMEKYKKSDEDEGTQGKYTRHSSVDGFCDSRENLTVLDYEKRRRSLSKSRDHQEFSDKIINELQNISQQKSDAEKIEKPKLARNKSASKVENNTTEPQPESNKINDIKMVTNLTKEIDSIGLLNLNGKVTGKESKLTRPKSYPNKSNEKIAKKVTEVGLSTTEPNATSAAELKTEESGPNKVGRPKSFPNSKITPPKDVKKSEPETKPVVTATKPVEKLVKVKQNGVVATSEGGEKKMVKKVIRTVKKTIKSAKSEDSSEKATEEKIDPAKPVEKKAESPEKKINKGFLYSIGQKFEKFRDGGKSKEAKKQEEPIVESSTTTKPALDSVEDSTKKKKTKPSAVTSTSTEKKSKIDSMIRNLREKSVPHSPQMTESRLLKRAVSVEDITSGGYNKSGVNKVLGLFKKYEKDSSTTQQNVSKLKNTKSSSNVDFDLETATNTQKNRKSLVTDPPSVTTNASHKPSGRKPNQYLGAKSDSILTLTDQLIQKSQLAAATIQTTAKFSKVGCSECNQTTEASEPQIIKRHSNNNNVINGGNSTEIETDKEKLKNKRKALVLDFSKFETNNSNNNNVICNINNNASDVNSFVKTNENSVNNNNISYPPPLPGDRNINNNHLNTPSYDNLINYTSEPRSPYDDCASTSTLFSPTDEPELYFDNWSVCSEDHPTNSGRPTPSSPSTSTRYSRNSTSHLITSPTSHADSSNPSSESIVDRIRRKSFYSRFNEKKPKRVSTIVGPAAKEYYHPRESSSSSTILPSASSSSAVASSKSLKSIKPLEYKRASSASVRTPTGGTSHEYYHPIKTSTLDNLYSNLSGSSTKLNTSNAYSHHHHHHHHHHHLPPSSLTPISSSSSKIHTNDYLSPTTAYSPSSHHHTSLLKKSDNLLNYSTSKRASSIYDGTAGVTPSSSSALSYSNSFNQRYSGGGHHSNSSSSNNNHHHYNNSNLGSTTTPSSYLNGNLEAYATLGRKPKPYEQRTVSLLNTFTPKLNSKTGTTTITGLTGGSGTGSSGLSGLGSSSSQREHRLGTDFGTISRNTLRMRTPTNSKSPSAT